MRTRRSPRNQELLWKYLGSPKPAPVKIDRIAADERALSLPFINKRTRRMFERDLAAAKQKAAVTAALAGEAA